MHADEMINHQSSIINAKATKSPKGHEEEPDTDLGPMHHGGAQISGKNATPYIELSPFLGDRRVKSAGIGHFSKEFLDHLRVPDDNANRKSANKCVGNNSVGSVQESWRETAWL
jgi:hypothetical protein